MCRSIKQLRYKDAEPTEQELHDAALQFVRKVSGYRVPSKRNEDAFEQAVNEIAEVTRKMLLELTPLPSAPLYDAVPHYPNAKANAKVDAKADPKHTHAHNKTTHTHSASKIPHAH